MGRPETAQPGSGQPCGHAARWARPPGRAKSPGGSGEVGAKPPEERSCTRPPHPPAVLSFSDVGGARGPAPKQVSCLSPFSGGVGSIAQLAQGWHLGSLGRGSPRPPASCMRGRAAPSALAEPAWALVCERPVHARSGGSRDLTPWPPSPRASSGTFSSCYQRWAHAQRTRTLLFPSLLRHGEFPKPPAQRRGEKALAYSGPQEAKKKQMPGAHRQQLFACCSQPWMADLAGVSPRLRPACLRPPRLLPARSRAVRRG